MLALDRRGGVRVEQIPGEEILSLLLPWLKRFESIGAESISQNPSKSLIAALGGSPSLAGVPVTEATVSGLPVVFACDRVIREDVAKTPLKIKRRNDKDGTRKDDPNHPVYTLLHDLANPAMSAYEFKDRMQSALNLWGNAYAEIQRNRRNEPVALWPLDPSRMTVDLDGLNRIRYSYRMGSGAPKEWIYDPANPPIFHLRQNARDPWYCGRSPIKVLRDAMGLAVAQQRYQVRHFGQGGHVQMTLTTANPLTPEAAKTVRKDFEDVTRGEENWHRTVVMPFGLEAKPLAMPHRDAQFVENLRLSRSELAGVFRVSAHKINDLEKATFSNVEHLAIQHVNDCLMPHFVCWQQAIARDLLNPRSFNTHFAVWKVDALVRGDFKALNDALQLQRQNGVISANDWRRMLDDDDLISAEDGGDLYLVNGNMMPMRRDPAAVVEMDPVGGVN